VIPKPRPIAVALPLAPLAAAIAGVWWPEARAVAIAMCAVLFSAAALDAIPPYFKRRTACTLAESSGLSLGSDATFSFDLTPRPGARAPAAFSPSQPVGVRWETPRRSVPHTASRTVMRAACARRGPSAIDEAVFSSVSHFGLFDMVERIGLDSAFAILPSLDGLARARTRAKRGVAIDIGHRVTRFRGGDGDLESLREYCVGEDARKIDWKASARTGEPLVRDRDSDSRARIAFAVDCGRLMTAERDGRSALDDALSAMLAAADAALRAGDSASACAFADRIVDRTPELSSRWAMSKLARFSSAALACDKEADFYALSAYLRKSLNKRSLVVVVTEAADTMPLRALERFAATIAAKHALIIAFLRDDELERDASRYAPGEVAGFRAAAAAELLELRDRAIARLRRYARVLLSTPHELPDAVIEAYLEAKARNLA
jgi:uncharacterized protein (DUF58 family)